MKKVIAMGTFDMVHPGHLSYLEQAKRFGTYLVVVIARDKTVEEERGRLPVVFEQDRLNIIEHIDIVDEAVLGNLGDKLKIVEELKPDVICLGYDHRINVKKLEKELSERGLNITIKRMKPYKKKMYKSSILKKEGLMD